MLVTDCIDMCPCVEGHVKSKFFRSLARKSIIQATKISKVFQVYEELAISLEKSEAETCVPPQTHPLSHR